MARLTTGEQFPGFELQTAGGGKTNSHEAIGKAKKTVFWVLRYAGCTSCRYDIHLIKERYQEFLDVDAQVLVVLQSRPETVKDALQGQPAPYQIICDPDQEIYRRFSIDPAPDKESRRPTDPAGVEKLRLKTEKIKASGFVHGEYEGNENQLPAIFITGQDGKVLYAHYAANSIDMPTVDEVLELLKTA